MSARWSRRPIRCRPPGSSTGWLATSIERSPRRVVTPVHQRVPPGRVADVSRGLLRQVPVHVAHHLAHVSGVVLGQIAFLSPKDLHDAPAGLVAGRLASRSFVADRLRLIGAEEVLELVGGHVDGVLPVGPDLGQGLLSSGGHRPTLLPKRRRFGSLLNKVIAVGDLRPSWLYPWSETYTI